MKTITVMCEKCWNTSVYPVHELDIDGYISRKIAEYERMYDWGPQVADPQSYLGRIYALRELRRHLKGELSNES